MPSRSRTILARRRCWDDPSVTSRTPTRKRLSARDRRSAILDAALEVFSRRGYHGAAIDEIAQAAGISKALIYEHFPSKKELHASLLARHVDDIFGALQRSVAASEPGEESLRAGVDAFFGWVEENGDAFRLLFRDVFERDVAEILTRLQSQATAGVAALLAPDPDSEQRLATVTFAQLLSGAVQSLAIWWQDHPEVERRYLVERVMDLAWRGLEQVSGAPTKR
jgi:AcrR family transcriptional regulator